MRVEKLGWQPTLYNKESMLKKNKASEHDKLNNDDPNENKKFESEKENGTKPITNMMLECKILSGKDQALIQELQEKN